MLGFIKITKIKITKYFKTIKLQNIKNINLFFHDNKVAAAPLLISDHFCCKLPILATLRKMTRSCSHNKENTLLMNILPLQSCFNAIVILVSVSPTFSL